MDTTKRNDGEDVRIAIYTRKSNDENLVGEVTSIESQKSSCRHYIAANAGRKWTEVAEEFDDPAESGKSLNRPAMQRLLKRIGEKKIDGVIVYKLDRLTRNSRDFHYLLDLFEKHNVAFISATESLDTKSPQGRLMTAIMVQFAQYDRELDVERSQDIHLSRARKGLWSAGLPPLGFDLVDKHLVVNDAEAEVVRAIFDLYLKEGSTILVAQELNRRGFTRKLYKTKNERPYGGNPFDTDSVIRILRRKVYIGIITNERTRQEFPGQHQRLIDIEVFNAAQKLLDLHNHRGGEINHYRNKYGFLLKGLLRCGECGSSVTPYVKPKGGKNYLYYRCLAQRNGLPVDCAFTSIGAQKLEAYVLGKLAQVAGDREFLVGVIEKLKGRSTVDVGDKERQRRVLEGRIHAANRDIESIKKLVLAGGNAQELADDLNRRVEAKAATEAELAKLEAEIGHRKKVCYDADVVAGVLTRFCGFVGRMPLTLRTQAIALLVEKVTLWKDRIDIQLHELPVRDLQRAIERKDSGGFGTTTGGEGGSPNPLRGPDFPRLCTGTPVVESRGDWRGRREQKTTDLIDPPVPTGPNTHYIPPFELSWPIKWASIENGERVFDEVLTPPAASRAGVSAGPEAPNFQSRRSIERREQKTTEGDLPEVEAVAEVAIGERYLTAAGVPVQVLGFRGELVLIQSLASENRFPLPLAYPLRPFDSAEPAFPVKERPNRPIDRAQPTVAPEKRRLSPLIDAMLLAGDMTMKGILRELRRKASAACRGRDLRANVRARISYLRKKGLQPRLVTSDT